MCLYSVCIYNYRRTPVSAGNTFEDLPQLRETRIMRNAAHNEI